MILPTSTRSKSLDPLVPPSNSLNFCEQTEALMSMTLSCWPGTTSVASARNGSAVLHLVALNVTCDKKHITLCTTVSAPMFRTLVTHGTRKYNDDFCYDVNVQMQCSIPGSSLSRQAHSHCFRSTVGRDSFDNGLTYLHSQRPSHRTEHKCSLHTRLLWRPWSASEWPKSAILSRQAARNTSRRTYL